MLVLRERMMKCLSLISVKINSTNGDVFFHWGLAKLIDFDLKEVYCPKFIGAGAPIKKRHILNISNGIAYIDGSRADFG